MAFTWFPGHMRKALRRIEADAVLVDLVLLLPLDERRAVLFLLKALRDGRWGPLTLERPEVTGPGTIRPP